MKKNKLIIAAAGSGKTRTLVEEALKITDKNVLITTFTEANEAGIKKKIIKETGGYIPQNITVQTWFSFLLQHGVRPYQSILNESLWDKKIGFYLTTEKSAKKYDSDGKPVKSGGHYIYWAEESNFKKHYFTNDFNIYSDKISKFILKCNEKTKENRTHIGLVVERLSKIFPHIFVDEIQDMVGYDLEILHLLFKSPSNILLVGDPRQVTYSTHPTEKNPSYKHGKIDKFIEDNCKSLCEIDPLSLRTSHRNNQLICNYSSKLFPEYEVPNSCDCEQCRNYEVNHEGIFVIKKEDIIKYCKKYSPTTLRWSKAIPPEWNFGLSKGLEFDRVLIHPTQPILNWIKNNNSSLPTLSRCKFYVALTRARYSVGIVYDYSDHDNFEGIEKYVVDN